MRMSYRTGHLIKCLLNFHLIIRWDRSCHNLIETQIYVMVKCCLGHFFKKKNTVIWTGLTGRRVKEQLKSFFLKHKHHIFTDLVWNYTVWVPNINVLWIKLNILCLHPKVVHPRKELRWNDYTKYVWGGEIPHTDLTQRPIIRAQTRREIRSRPCWLLL